MGSKYNRYAQTLIKVADTNTRVQADGVLEAQRTDGNALKSWEE